jgi:hypothetical protein
MPTAFRQRAAVAVLAASVVLVAVLLALGVGGDASHKAVTASGSVDAATGEAGAAEAAAAPPWPMPVAGGIPLTAADAWLVAPPPPLVQSMAPGTAPCTALGDPGWAVQCGEVDMAAGRRVWLVEHRPAAPSTLWRALILEWSPAKSAWLVDLAFDNEDIAPGHTAPVDLRAITVKAGDLTGDGKAELVFGFRSAAAGQHLAYDIVTSAPGAAPSVSASRSGLARGQVAVGGGVLTEYVGAYLGSDSECCPAQFEKTDVQWSGSSFRLLPSAPVPPPGPGQLDL